MTMPLLCLLIALSLPLVAAPISPVTHAAVMRIADAEGVPRSVARALMWEESRGDATARSPRTADGYRSWGLFQIYDEPGNLVYLVDMFWRARGEGDAFDYLDSIHNSKVALRYLAALHRQYGNWFQALLFYNCGRVRGAPDETRAYALRIMRAP